MRIGPLGLWELLIVLFLVLLVFGPRRLPAMARGVAQAIREFGKGVRSAVDGPVDEAADSSAAPADRSS